MSKPRATTSIRREALPDIREACVISGKKVTDFVSQAAWEAAKHVISEHRNVTQTGLIGVPVRKKARKCTHAQ